MIISEFEDKNEILINKEIQQDMGYVRMDNGDYLVAMTCPMPGITKEMIDWWFWWHPQDSQRYQMWYPGEHFAISYAKKDKDYFTSPFKGFKPNTQYPVERIGTMKMPLRIDFITPQDFGFSAELMKQNHVETIVSGHVGAYKGLIQHTEMAHIFFKSDDGLFLVSCFWIGKRLHNPLIRHFILTDNTAQGMATHCYHEYRNLAKILPDLYNKEVSYI